MIDNEKVEELMLVLEEKLEKTTSVLREEYANIRAGRANPHVLDKILVDYYGTMSPINQVGNIAVADAKRLVISPWDTSLLKGIEKAILQSNIGLTPTNDGKVIRLIFPDLTEERRKEIAKQIKALSEGAKVAARNIRRDAMDQVKKMKTGKEISEDECASIEKDIDKTLSKQVELIDKYTAEKEKEIMSV
ncbi:MAG TPA: ribosome recycling factor [Candidatus Borkfalkia excrementigallinarum]|uniref:Ribosome-recycling factor n=1 Tax=Candidatus Borkfalkia excrementigallinarum TaxID=2838506 RepID=A0A9D2CT62_9FIRM|nr:ribosome recycling factor [Candidatus Borkfalkia excrementigallinarum]